MGAGKWGFEGGEIGRGGRGKEGRVKGGKERHYTNVNYEL